MFRHLTVLLAIAITSRIVPAAQAEESSPPKTVMSQAGKLLFQDKLAAQPGKQQWRFGPGDWTVESGSLKGAERPADKHGAVLRHPMTFRDAIICYDVQLNGAKVTTLSINDAKEHVCRMLLRPNGFTVRKDDHDHDGPDQAVEFETKPLKIGAGEWHSLVIEIRGPEMVATLDGQHTIFGAHESLNCEKANFGFTVAGQTAAFRNVQVWEALPNSGWEKTKAKLTADRAKTAQAIPPQPVK